MSILKGEYEVIMTRFDDEIEFDIVNRYDLMTEWTFTVYEDDVFDAIAEITSQYNVTKITTKEAR